MIEKIIDCIPSLTMRNYLRESPAKLSVLQQATVVSEYASKEQKVVFFEKLIEISSKNEERILLKEAIKDTKKYGSPNKKTKKIYDRYFLDTPRTPLFPFLEICNFPVLFKRGDIIFDQEDFWYVADVPRINQSSDFTDECYLCYSLSEKAESEEDLFTSHGHIHVCMADIVDLDELTVEQKLIAENIALLLNRR